MKLFFLLLIVFFISCHKNNSRYFHVYYFIGGKSCTKDTEGDLGLVYYGYPSKSYIDTVIDKNFLSNKRECYGSLIIRNIIEFKDSADYFSFWEGHKSDINIGKKEECCPDFFSVESFGDGTLKLDTALLSQWQNGK